MGALSSVLVKFTADITDLASKLKEGTRQIEETARQAESTGGRLGGVFDKFKSMALPAIGAVSTALGGLSAWKGIEFNADMEQSLISFETLLHSADKAQEMVKQLQAFAAQTPFEFPGLQNSAKLMLAMGFNAESILPNLKAVGDAVAAVGGNQETLQGVTLALGQMLTKGKVSAEEMNQLAERGIPAWDIMAQKMGMSKEQLMKLSEQGKVFAKDALPALIEGMGERFSGAMERQSKSFTGMLSTLKDNLNMVLGQAMEPLFNKLKAILPVVNEFVGKLNEGFKADGIRGALEAAFPPAVAATINTILQAVTGLFNFIKDNWGTLQPVLAGVLAGFMAFKAITGLVSAFNAVNAAIQGVGNVLAFLSSPVGIAVVAIGALVAAGWVVVKNWDTIKNTLTGTWDAIKNAAASTWGGIKDFFQTTWDGIKATAATAWEGIKAVLQNAVAGMVEVVRNLPIINYFVKNWDDIKARTQAAWEGIKAAVKLALDLLTAVITDWTVVGVVIRHWDEIAAYTRQVWEQVAQWLNGVWTTISTTASQVWQTISQSVSNTWEAIKVATETAWDTVKTFLQNTWNAVKTNTENVLNTIKSLLQNTWDAIKSNTESAWNAVKSFLQDTWNAIRSNTESVMNAIKSFLQSTWNQVKAASEQTWNSISSFLQNTYNQIKASTEQTWNAVKQTITNLLNQIKQTVDDALNAIRNKITDTWNSARSVTESAWSAVKSTITGYITQAKNTVGQAVDYMKDKLDSVVEAARKAVDAAKAAYDKAKSWASQAASAVKGGGGSPPKMADGGLFTKATNIVIGERGLEAAVPLKGHRMKPFAAAIASQLGSIPMNTGGGGGVNITVNQLAVREEADIERIAGELHRLMKRGQRAKGVI